MARLLHVVTGDPDGVALWWDDHKVVVVDSLWDAQIARRAARHANVMLAATLSLNSQSNLNDTADALRARFQGE